MRTLVISDLHLGAANAEDLLRLPAFREPLAPEVRAANRIVLLGDVIELRDLPLADALARAAPFFEWLGEIAGDAEVVLVPGNHDHHLLETWFAVRRLDSAEPLGLEQRASPAASGPLRALARRMGRTEVGLAYPGLWVRDDVYAFHGHYLDRHLTIPTFERLGIAAIERVLGVAPGGPDPLAPPEGEAPISPEDYERAQAPIYALLFALAQGGKRTDAGSPSARIWAALGEGPSRTARLRGWLLGSVALPGAVGMANRLGLGPVQSDLSPGAITRAGLAAAADVVWRLRIEADFVIFGHTHRRGPLGGEPGWTAPGGVRLLNSGSWVHAPALLGETAADSPYWPGTAVVVGERGEPEARHLLDALSRAELAADA